MTVSRVLSGSDQGFSEETRRKVLEAVRELDYVPVTQPMTQSRRNVTRVIGLVFDCTPFNSVWGLPTFMGFHEAAQKHDYDLLTLTRACPEWMTDREEMQFLDRRNDGFIFIAPDGKYQLLEALVKRDIPVVACYRKNVPPEIPAIVLDNHDAMHQVVQCLGSNGHERILYLTIDEDRSDFHDRRSGYEQAMLARQLEPMVHDIGRLSPHDAELLVKTVRDRRITAIAGHTDGSASFAWDALEAHGFKIPQDISITGMDDMADSAQRGLTSVHFSCEEVGRRAMEAVVNIVEVGRRDTCRSIVPVKLIERSSVTHPAKP
jgi:DNA-binding LacI/PurR family transcriptional regulator